MNLSTRPLEYLAVALLVGFGMWEFDSWKHQQEVLRAQLATQQVTIQQAQAQIQSLQSQLAQQLAPVQKAKVLVDRKPILQILQDQDVTQVIPPVHLSPDPSDPTLATLPMSEVKPLYDWGNQAQQAQLQLVECRAELAQVKTVSGAEATQVKDLKQAVRPSFLRRAVHDLKTVGVTAAVVVAVIAIKGKI
jgi:hypothetical protein